AALSNQLQSQVADQRAKLPKLEQSVKELEIRIKELEKKIAATKKQQQATQKAIDTASTKLTNTKNDFEATYQLIKGQIERDINNMQTYFK
ncbi:MAG: hypothetical protein AAF828_05585, partial [Bacteroidota bacterium]